MIYRTLIYKYRSGYRASNKLEQPLNPYFTYRPTGIARGALKGCTEGVGVSRVLNLKVKPPPLLPNPRVEREGCLCSFEPFNRFKWAFSFATRFSRYVLVLKYVAATTRRVPNLFRSTPLFFRIFEIFDSQRNNLTI